MINIISLAGLTITTGLINWVMWQIFFHKINNCGEQNSKMVPKVSTLWYTYPVWSLPLECGRTLNVVGTIPVSRVPNMAKVTKVTYQLTLS
jgi:hypothetical protein